MRILIVAAHPDDEVLGCGGTIARMIKENHEVYVAILGEGITSRYQHRELADSNFIEALHTCSHRVKEYLRVQQLFLFNLPDNRFDSIPLIEVVQIIEGLIVDLRPQVVYTQHGGDLNIDHVVVHRATLTATRPVGGSSVKELFAYEIPSSTEWAFGQFTPVFQPNRFVDISSTLEIKIEAMQLYESESRQFPHPRSPEALRAIARRWGSTVGLNAAEPFQLIRSVE